MIRFRLSSPCVGFKPTIPLAVDGPLMDPPVSVPIPRGAYPAAIATPVPPDDPAGDRHRSCGFREWRPSELYAPADANSDTFTFDTTITPASRSFFASTQ